ncbi:hypothetical protein BDV93DRAFT_562974 [Ceratobasidium sp. AG-I]|nr:hypothetical protein BDV93DRAFT_562974 [Ceratobasidium sp. AG-I]
MLDAQTIALACERAKKAKKGIARYLPGSRVLCECTRCYGKGIKRAKATTEKHLQQHGRHPDARRPEPLRDNSFGAGPSRPRNSTPLLPIADKSRHSALTLRAKATTEKHPREHGRHPEARHPHALRNTSPAAGPSRRRDPNLPLPVTYDPDEDILDLTGRNSDSDQDAECFPPLHSGAFGTLGSTTWSRSRSQSQSRSLSLSLSRFHSRFHSQTQSHSQARSHSNTRSRSRSPIGSHSGSQESHSARGRQDLGARRNRTHNPSPASSSSDGEFVPRPANPAEDAVLFGRQLLAQVHGAAALPPLRLRGGYNQQDRNLEEEEEEKEEEDGGALEEDPAIRVDDVDVEGEHEGAEDPGDGEGAIPALDENPILCNIYLRTWV